jgi:hypothetical protein
VVDTPLSVADALTVIREGGLESHGHLALLYAAITVMDLAEHDETITISDMLHLLNYLDTLFSEMGARALYVRTGRDNLGRKAPDSTDQFVTDKAEWIEWLANRGLLGESMARTD